ncbi:MAG: translocase [Rhodospirillaceae bacterium]|nr:translocase [Rhodospirillaceae bacterium]|tara:strand:+ start:7775 stop:8431 length:657 start_codon:yes stop_codon:yes gene_type:complete
MNDGFAFFDIIIFAMLAVYLVFQLRRVLGRKTGMEKPPANEFSEEKEPSTQHENIIPLHDRNQEQAVSESGITRLRQLDTNFNEKEFISGSRSAFSWIVSAFAAGDSTKLEPLLGPKLFKNFEQAIQERVAAGEKLETNIVSIKSAQIDEVSVEGNTATVTVEFVSDQIKVVRDSEQNMIDGDPDTIESLTDLWTFSRDVTSPNPNWILTRTETPTEN